MAAKTVVRWIMGGILPQDSIHLASSCQAEFRRALALNPSFAYAHDQSGMALALQHQQLQVLRSSSAAVILDSR